MSNLAKLLAAMSDDDDDDARPAPLPEAQVMMLRELAAVYRAGNVYRVGDLVTPRAGVNGINGAGLPHIVVETRQAPADFTITNDNTPGTPGYGASRDVRVIAFCSSDYCTFWMESWTLEPYRGPA